MPSDRTHPIFSPPVDVYAPIWRYMDFTKYVALLESRALYFTRADLLGDPFEGSMSRGNLTLRPQAYSGVDIPPEAFQYMSFVQERARYWTFINCWHLSDHESAAMWRLYSATNHAIAVTSTYSALCDALPENARVGIVRYIDYATEWLPEGNTLWPYLHKRHSFKHEQELRAVIQEFPTQADKLDLMQGPVDLGRLVQVPLNSLIQRVVVAPTAPTWFRDLTEALTRRYKLNVTIEQSQLDEIPIF